MLIISIPHATRQNGSQYLHLFTLPHPEHQPDTHKWDFWRLRQDPLTVYTRIKLTQYHVPETTTFKLLQGGGTNKLKKDQSPTQDRPDEQLQWVTHLKSHVTFNIPTNNISLPRGDHPPRQPGFDPGSGQVGFVVDKVALGQFSEVM
jgi:hypothetical protein